MSGITPVSSLPGLTAAGALGGAGMSASAASVATPAASATGTSFADSLAGAVDTVQSLQSDANTLAVRAVTGNLDDIADATIAATRAQVTMELVAAVRNKGVDAFNQIMTMQA